MCWESDATSFLHALDPDPYPSVNSSGPKNCSQPILSLDFGVSLVLDPSVNPP